MCRAVDAESFFSLPDGYVKTDLVEIDFDKLKNQSLSQMAHDDGEVYDDVATQDDLNRYGIRSLFKSNRHGWSSNSKLQL